MDLVLGLAVIAIVGWLLWFWLSRARRVALASHEAQEKIEADRTRPGALPSDAITVASAATIEPRVEREPCPYCAGALHIDQHEVEEHGDRRLRRVHARCGRCSKVSTTWFHVRTLRPN